jgi:bis(5'-nucleosyl)-tetraphosphatase (symmetrical)
VALYAIGDIQGCAQALDDLLRAIAFDPTRDRLWLVGDLVNRGPDSLRVLRTVMALDTSLVAVLGNHDLHLLAAVAGIRAPRAQDTLDAVLAAPDRDAIVDWLRARPLLHHDIAGKRVLVHAGIPPCWTVAAAAQAARAVETVLRGPGWVRGLATMYGNAPRQWRPQLAEDERVRFTINALTRMRAHRPTRDTGDGTRPLVRSSAAAA